MNTEFQPLKVVDLINTLGLTIKRDEANKVITFLGFLSAYSEDSQINISYNAPSSTGKTFIALEIGSLFPKKDVMEVAYCSPTAFFHLNGEFNKERGGYIVDLSRKIIVFLDQPHTLLLQHLRPLLSHDKKEICLKITDKSQRFGLRTKNVYLIGYPAVVFSTAGLNVDEQESTRFLLLSPETSVEKIRESVIAKIKKGSDFASYTAELESNVSRTQLKERIQAIKEKNVSDIKISSPELIERTFFQKVGRLKPRHSRDVGRIVSLVKTFALLNLWFREWDGDTLIANEEDIVEAFKIWDLISESQELNLPPYVYNLYKDVILEAYHEKNSLRINKPSIGISRQEIMQKHAQCYSRFLPDWQLRQQIIPPLETAGLIVQIPDVYDHRKILIVPTDLINEKEGERK